jgi:hypothetical protein
MFGGPHSMGLSAQAIAGGGSHHPWDPADLLRCINYCERARLSTADLRTRMAGRSIQWDRLLPEWDNLAKLLRHEMATRTDHIAPLTYRAMKRVLDDGVACVVCDGSGRGTECAKCKGTGRRSGGRCRAENCYRGADFCPACNGKGYTAKELANA